MNLHEILNAFEQTIVLVTGDPMVDVYHHGRCERLSPEAPVPVFLEERAERRPGGAANVAANLGALGCMTITGFPDTEWIEKHRFLVGHQQLFRIDREQIYTPGTDPGLRDDIDAVVISDYAKGVCSEAFCHSLINQYQGVPIVVDPKGTDWRKYRGATVVCPNEREYNDFERYAQENLVLTHIVLKRGEKGIQLLRPRGAGGDGVTVEEFPATARHVFDVTGAGDTVTAVVAATLGAGGTMSEACLLANLAAGYVVGEVGTAVCPIEKLRELVNERGGD